MSEAVSSTAGGGAGRGEAERVVVRRLAKRLRRGQDVRRRKVRRVKLSVQAGAYENDLKLIIAVERMLESLRR
jgi:hypothetical protein